MSILRRMSVVAKIFSRCAHDPAVGCWKTKDEHLEIGHHYSKKRDGSGNYEHRFCARNFKAKSYVFDRTVTVAGGSYTPAGTSAAYEVKARNSQFVGAVEIEEAPCAELAPDGGATVTTAVQLLLRTGSDDSIPTVSFTIDSALSP